MKQVLQQLRDGRTILAEVPAPQARPNHLLVKTRTSLISVGTERMLVEFGKASLIAKARSHPDKVRQVLDKVRADGLLPTLEAVFSRLDEPLPLGYCNAGEVVAVGPGVTEFRVGDRVISNGAHAEWVCVPKTLAAKIPEEVSDEQAAFTVLASVGLQGIRLAEPTLGETFAVIGLGLVGLITAQLLRANGCRVVGTDIDPGRLALAEKFGVQPIHVGEGSDPVAAALAATQGRGVDGVIITASAKNEQIIQQAAKMCRRRGRIVLVGVVPLQITRSDFYEKELSFQVSCSYGPGRYDDQYERQGHDYPLGFVRWTEGRNFEAVLDALARRTLDVDSMVTHRFSLSEAEQAYQILDEPDSLGIILQYPQDTRAETKVSYSSRHDRDREQAVVAAVVGGGNFSKRVLLPALSKSEAALEYVVDPKPPAAGYLATKFGVAKATTDHEQALADGKVNTVFLAVGHHLHADLAVACLEAGKHVFVEKPLALSLDELQAIITAVEAHPDRQLMVGFNRRFAPHTETIQNLIRGRNEPLAMNMTVNAGAMPADHWVHDPRRGGGRIVGEACHFIDLLAYYAQSTVSAVSAAIIGEGPAVREDKMAITLTFTDGSIGNISYFANGAKSYAKEQLEIFSDGRVLRLDNFRTLTGYGFDTFRRQRLARQDKGHLAEIAAFVKRVQLGGELLIPFDQLLNTTLASFAAVAAANEQRVVRLDEEYADVIRPAVSTPPAASINDRVGALPG